jgi:hypothetical protein
MWDRLGFIKLGLIGGGRNKRKIGWKSIKVVFIFDLKFKDLIGGHII